MIVSLATGLGTVFMREVETEAEAFYEMRRYAEVNKFPERWADYYETKIIENFKYKNRDGSVCLVKVVEFGSSVIESHPDKSFFNTLEFFLYKDDTGAPHHKCIDDLIRDTSEEDRDKYLTRKLDPYGRWYGPEKIDSLMILELRKYVKDLERRQGLCR